MEYITDEQLVKRYLKGDEASLEALIKRYLPLIFGFARQYVGSEDKASDIAQETFVKVWKHLKKFDQKRSFKSWIYTIAKNTALDWLKRKEEIPFSQFDSEDEDNFISTIQDTAPLPTQLIDAKEGIAGVNRLIEKLPNDYREVVSLRHEKELTFEEIARRVKAPLNTVKSRYRRALISLRKQVVDPDLEL